MVGRDFALSPLFRHSLAILSRPGARRTRETAAHKLRAFTDPEIMGIRWVLSTRARQTRVTNCAPIDYRPPKSYTYTRFSATIREPYGFRRRYHIPDAVVLLSFPRHSAFSMFNSRTRQSIANSGILVPVTHHFGASFGV